jgi:hypothetical protein
MAPKVTTKAAKRSSEEKTRRHRDGVKVEVRGRFLIIGIAGGLNWLVLNGTATSFLT